MSNSAELLKNLYLEFAPIAEKQMKDLNDYHTANRHLLIHNHADFVPEDGYYLEHIAIDETGSLLAVFTLFGFESTGTYVLNLDSGFESEMSKMNSAMEKRKQYLELEKKRQQTARKEQYEKLKAEFGE